MNRSRRCVRMMALLTVACLGVTSEALPACLGGRPNGTVESPEICDDGNSSSTDRCLNDCTLPFCGDGIVRVAGSCGGDARRPCDDDEDCTSAAACTVEACDDGNRDDCDACRNDCSGPVTGCGDGVVCAPEECDPPASEGGNARCSNLCREAVCGNGIVERPQEECDSGTALCRSPGPANGLECGTVPGRQRCDADGGTCGDGNSDREAGGCRTDCRSLGAQPIVSPAPMLRHETDADETIPHAPGRYFRARRLDEGPSSGHHEHAVVTLLDIPILVIRDEDVFKTIGERAHAIARVLQESLHTGDRLFIIGEDANRPAIYLISHHGGYPRFLLGVSARDAVAYTRRSGRRIDQHLLAEWWRAVLQDMFRAVFFNDPARLTVSAGTDGSLTALRGKLWPRGETSPVSPRRVTDALFELPVETRRRLERLAFAVPAEFEPLSQSLGGTGEH